MNVEAVTFDRHEARELWRDYKKHQHYSAPIDEEIRRTYQLIAQGRVVIRALDSIRSTGLAADGWPKLAICRATAPECFCEINSDGRAQIYDGSRRPQSTERTRVFSWPAGSFIVADRKRNFWEQARALVPAVPIHLRPKRGLANYHVLWEAEWERIVSRDPMLLRRIGKADLWLVVAAWDLTAVEQAVLQARVSS